MLKHEGLPARFHDRFAEFYYTATPLPPSQWHTNESFPLALQNIIVEFEKVRVRGPNVTAVYSPAGYAPLG